MFAVTVCVPDRSALAERMTTMRQWLDDQRMEPVLFRYLPDRSDIVVLVAFRSESEAADFAAAFDGDLTDAAAA